METGSVFVQPVLALVVWSMVMWLWMYVTRLPAIAKMEMKMDSHVPSGVQMSQLPAKVRWKADNYNHLMEQPTLFYAVVLSLAVLGQASELNIYLAWAYVGLRIVHSLVHAMTNIVEVRFVLFILSNIPLAALTANTAISAFL